MYYVQILLMTFTSLWSFGYPWFLLSCGDNFRIMYYLKSIEILIKRSVWFHYFKTAAVNRKKLKIRLEKVAPNDPEVLAANTKILSLTHNEDTAVHHFSTCEKYKCLNILFHNKGKFIVQTTLCFKISIFQKNAYNKLFLTESI